MKRRYGIVISAMILAIQFNGLAQADEPTIEQLEQIAVLLDANDVRGTRSFIQRHPELLEGETELAQLLRQYMTESDNLIGFIGVSPNSFDGRTHGEGSERLRAALGDPGTLGAEEPDGPTTDGADPDVALY